MKGVWNKSVTNLALIFNLLPVHCSMTVVTTRNYNMIDNS